MEPGFSFERVILQSLEDSAASLAADNDRMLTSTRINVSSDESDPPHDALFEDTASVIFVSHMEGPQIISSDDEFFL